jgi:two-component system C4-dicarboxylate transport response regulator DctD
MSRGTIAFIDDEARLCEAAAEWLGVSGFTVDTFENPALAVERVAARNYDCVVTDMRMPGLTGLEVLEHVRASDPDLPVVLLTGHGDVPLAVEAMRGGAYDFIEKPYDADHLVAVLDRAVERRRLKREIARLAQRLSPEDGLESQLVGVSPGIVDLRRTIAQLADVDVDVLIRGETGTGKEVVARALHALGRRGQRPFVAINCAAVPESIFESEIFGHEKGAFTGAASERLGKFEYAQGGTVFLDEIESMPPALQAKVLRAIQERSVERLGSNNSRPIDVRFIAASKTDLRAESEAGRFRSDLYFRLGTVELAIPPLRERREDIPLLYALFANDATKRFNVAANEVSEAALRTLMARDWPGNVRELKATAERAALGINRKRDAAAPAQSDSARSLPDRMARFEAEAIAEALREAGSTAEAAKRLGLPRRTLNEKIARYGLRNESV